MRILELSEYSEEWINRYRREEKSISLILGKNLVEIQHIGSTSVPGLRAKPIIDIMAAVVSLTSVDNSNPEFRNAGYECMGEYGIPGRRYFRKAHFLNEKDWVDLVHLHIFHSDDRINLLRHAAMRDFLSTHPDDASAYGHLKSDLVSRCGNDLDCYITGKEKFVKDLEKRALLWYWNGKSE